MDERLKDAVEELDEEILEFDDALNLFYVMCEAARSDALNLDRYASALEFVLELLREIESKFGELSKIVSQRVLLQSEENAGAVGTTQCAAQAPTAATAEKEKRCIDKMRRMDLTRTGGNREATFSFGEV